MNGGIGLRTALLASDTRGVAVTNDKGDAADMFGARGAISRPALSPDGGFGETRLMNERLKAAGRQSRMVICEGVDHQIPSGGFRADMLRRADAFLRGALDIRTQTAASGR